MTRTVTTVPAEHRTYAAELLPLEQQVGGLGSDLQDALDRFERECRWGGFCATVSGAEVSRHALHGTTLAEWVAAIGHAFEVLDTTWICELPGSARTLDENDVLGYVEALGAFPLLEQSQAWAAGIAHAAGIEQLIAQGLGAEASDALASLADYEDNPLLLRAALLALGDLDDLEDRIDAVTDRGHWTLRILAGARDSVVGAGELVWGLTAQGLYDPRGWAGNWGDMGSALWWGVNNPGDFALAIIDWEGLQDDPARWLGGFAPDAALAFVTAGTGVVATRGTSASRAALRGLRTADSLSGRISALKGVAHALHVDVAVSVRTLGGRAVTWTPVGFVDDAGNVARVTVGSRRGPLSQLSHTGFDVGDTFRSGQYVTRRTTTWETYYRVTAVDGAGRPGSFWTPARPAGPMAAEIDLALQPAWGNTAQAVTQVRIPPGQVVYEGLAAPQPFFARGNPSPMHSGLTGGGVQIYLPNVPEDWIVHAYRFGTP